MDFKKADLSGGVARIVSYRLEVPEDAVGGTKMVFSRFSGGFREAVYFLTKHFPACWQNKIGQKNPCFILKNFLNLLC